MNNKDLLKQYVNTGAILSDNQIRKLSPTFLKTYLRRRILQDGHGGVFDNYDIQPIEFDLMSDELRKQLMYRQIERDDLKGYVFDWASDEFKEDYIKKGNGLPYQFFNVLPIRLKRLYALKELKEGLSIDGYLVNYLDDEEIKDYLEKRAKNGYSQKARFFGSLPEHLKLYYCELLMRHKVYFTYGPPFEWVKSTGKHFIPKYINLKLANERILDSPDYKEATPEQQMESIRIAHLFGRLSDYDYVVSTHSRNSSVKAYYAKLYKETYGDQ